MRATTISAVLFASLLAPRPTYTTYTWDPAGQALVAGEASLTPADQFPGHDAARQELSVEGWIVSAV